MILKQSALQRFLYANSDASNIRQRSKPRFYDRAYFALRGLSKGLKAAIVRAGDIKSVIDIGCGDEPYKSYFESKTAYVGVDYYSEKPGVKKIDIETSFKEFEADFVVCSEVLEHTFHFDQVVENIYQNLKPGGSAYVSVPFAYELHGWNYNDFFRYSPKALQKIFAKFSEVEITPTTTFPGTILLRVNNIIYYIPLPYILKIPFFLLNNILFLLIEYAIRGLIGLLKLKPESLPVKWAYSFPTNFTCYLKK